MYTDIQSWKTGWNFYAEGGGGGSLSLESTVYPLVGPEFCFGKSDNSMSVGDDDLGIYLFYFNNRYGI